MRSSYHVTSLDQTVIRGSFLATLRFLLSCYILLFHFPTKSLAQQAPISSLNPQQLQRYSCLLDRIDAETWRNADGIHFDEKGIIQRREQYHPLSICQYGMLCLDQFRISGDSSWLNSMRAQTAYFRDTTLVHNTFSGKGLGLPYHNRQKGLEPPWYSGMTQGYALSFLLRYRETTGDATLDPLIPRIAFHMLQPQDSGGCMRMETVSKHPWIEEYPNSKLQRQVLNGSVNGFIGLWEYCAFFPADKRADSLRKQVHEGLALSFQYFDEPGWTRYQISGASEVSNRYLRYQIFQMRHLYALTRDRRFLSQMLLWCKMAHGREVPPNAQGFDLIYRFADFAVPAYRDGDAIRPDWAQYSKVPLQHPENPGAEVPKFPWIGYYQSGILKVPEGRPARIALRCKSDIAYIYYRRAPNEFLMAREKWLTKNSFDALEAEWFMKPGVWQYMVVFSVRNPFSHVEVLEGPQ